MTAHRLAAERIAELKRHYPRGAYSPNRKHHPFGHIAYSTIDIHELIDALESAYAELTRLRSAPSSLDTSDEACKRRILCAAHRTGYVDFDEEDVSEADIEIVRELMRDIQEDARSAPVAVEVPEEIPPDALRIALQCGTSRGWEGVAESAWTSARQRVRTIDPSRILKDGEREELEILREIADIARPRTRKLDSGALCDATRRLDAVRRRDALRSGEAEGRRG